MNATLKVFLVVIVLLYVVSPIDVCPGPIDDVIVVLLGIAANRKLGTNE